MSLGPGVHLGSYEILALIRARAALQPLTAVSPDVPAASTITSPALTQLGVILGTAAYMSAPVRSRRSAERARDRRRIGRRA